MIMAMMMMICINHDDDDNEDDNNDGDDDIALHTVHPKEEPWQVVEVRCKKGQKIKILKMLKPLKLNTFPWEITDFHIIRCI